MPKKPKLKFFDTTEEVLSYVTSELIATLRDDYESMEHDEDNAEDVKDLKAKVHDIEQTECLIVAAPEMLKFIQTILNEVKPQHPFYKEAERLFKLATN